MNRPLQWRFLPLSLALLLYLPSARPANAGVLYLENFGATVGQTPLSAVGWTGDYGNASTNATALTAGSSGSPANAQLSGGTGAPTNASNVNAGSSISNVSGFATALSNNGAQSMLIYTSGFTLDRTAYNLSSFQWYAGSQFSGDTESLAVQIGSNWYATTATASPPGGIVGGMGFSTGAQELTIPFATAASDWQTINFTSGSPLTLGPVLASSLPSGNITAFGLWIQLADNSTARTYFDTFTVNAVAVPEPGAWVLVVTGLMAWPFYRRMARRS